MTNETASKPQDQVQDDISGQLPIWRKLFNLHRERLTVLDCFLIYNNVPRKQLADRLKISPSMLSRVLSGENAVDRHIKVLQSVGIPKFLLPVPVKPQRRQRVRPCRLLIGPAQAEGGDARS